jgi:hypothetical protein
VVVVEVYQDGALHASGLILCCISVAKESLKYGTPYWIRTSDPRLRRPMLYPAELREQRSFNSGYLKNIGPYFTFSFLF